MADKCKKVFNGKLLKVFTTIKKLPWGKEAYFEVVKHPGASLIVPSIGNKIVFIRQLRPVVGKELWELPAGTLEKNETPYKCAKREVKEETGYLVKNLKKIGVIYTTPGFSDEKIHIYQAECTQKGEIDPDEDEKIEVHLFSRKKIKEMFYLGQITDSKTIAALAFAGII